MRHKPLSVCASAALFALLLAPTTPVADWVQNGDFEAKGRKGLPDGWSTSKKRVSGVQFVWDPERPHSGKRCVGIVSSYAQKTPWFWWDQEITGLKQGEKYRLSGWVRGEGTPFGSHLGVRFYNSSHTEIQSALIQDVHKAGAEWKEVHADVDIPPGTATAVLRLSMHGLGAVWMDDVRLEGVGGAAGVLGTKAELPGQSRVYPVSQASTPIVADGKIDDWTGVPWVNVGKTVEVSFAEAEVMNREASKGEKDLSFEFALRHDPKNLYLLVGVRDDVFHPSTPYWQGDSIQFAIDTTYGRSTKGLGPGDYALGVGFANDQAQAVIDSAPSANRLTAQDIKAGFSRAQDGYTVELAMPWEGLGLKAPAHNQRLGFSIVVNDSDGGGRKWAEWTPGIVKKKRPADFGTLILMRGGDLGLSLEGPPEAVPDTAPLNLTAFLVSTANKEQKASLTLTVDTGAESKAQSRELVAATGVTRTVFAFEAGAVNPGKHTATAKAGDLSSDCRFEVLPVRAMARETEERLAKLNDRTAVLSGLVAKGRKADLDVALPDVTLATAELFQKWIPADMKRLGAESLALQEAQRLAPLIESAIQQAQDILANPNAHPAVKPPDALAARIRNGGWYAADRPMFFFGFSQTGPDCRPMLPRFGCNLVVAHPGGPDKVFANGPELDPKRIEAAVEDIRNSAALGLRSDLFTKHDMPKWLIGQFRDVKAAEGHFMPYDIDHPEARKLVCELLEAVGRITAGEPGVLSYQLWNEANYDQLSRRGLANFREDMRRQYGDIAKLNAEWGTQFASFDAVKPVTRDPGQAAAYSDWCRWNNARVTDYIAAMHDAVRRGNPNAAAHVKVPNELGIEGSKTKNGQTQAISEHWQGIDRWALSQLLEIQGSDTRPTMLSDQYAIAFPYPFMAFDLQRSMDPAKPIFDSEWHGIQTVYYQNGDIPAEFLNASLWLSYLHGMDANMTWSWSRDGVNPKGGESAGSPFHGSLLSQPQLLDAFGRNSVTVQRLAPEIVAFTDAAPRVRLLFSKPSAILDINHLDAQAAAYETLAWLDAPVGFVMEEMLLNGFSDFDLLVVPAARHASPGVREAVGQLAETGKRVILIGKDCLTLTPHGKPIYAPASIKAEAIPSPTDAAAFEAAMEKANIKRPARCIGLDGASSKPVEFRSVTMGNRRLGYYVSLGKEPAAIRIELNGQPARWKSLLTGKTHEGPLTVKLWDMDLFEFE